MNVKTVKYRSLKACTLVAVGLVMLSSYTVNPQKGNVFHEIRPLQTDSVSLDDLSGYFRFPNRVAYIRFFDQDGQFIAQQAWDGRTYPLQRTGSLTFQSRDEAYQVAFIGGTDGKIDKAKILNRVMLEKVFFNPTQYVSLTADQLMPLLGRYRLQTDNNMEINVTRQGNKLAVEQLWDNKTIVFEAFSPTDFLNEELSFPLTFILANGTVKELICFESDRWERIDHE
ncbi:MULTISPECIES: hypothetical protein [Olivibacter]|uniref:DUF3108 domain-containing protein n=1 Tax=Olivibacter jilunii TaxID=985016 RepID=A0ABW6B6B1_9SPHI|nr:hypothetical protein [Pseudosphingobacterium sp.]